MHGCRPATRRRARPSRRSSPPRNTRSRSWWWRRGDIVGSSAGGIGGTVVMRSRLRLAVAALCVLVLPVAPASAQPASTPPAPAVTDADRNSPPYTMAVDARVAVRADLTAAIDNAVRFKVLRESAIRTLGQQNLSDVGSLNPLEVVEAY